MGGIVHVRNSDYSRYEELLMRRDSLEKEAFQWDREYIRVFGDMILRIFELKIECIRKKKTITFCQAAVNHGRIVDQEELQNYLEEEMALYQTQLNAMIEDNEAAKKTDVISQIELLEIKKIYRRLAKQIHPDINPMVLENEKLQDLWDRISIAYKCNKLKEIKELEILVSAVLKSIGEEEIEIDIPDIWEKIAELEAEIDNLRNTDPYMYKYILENPAAVKEKKAAFDEEYASYEEYSKQLDEIIQDFMASGVTFKWRMN